MNKRRLKPTEQQEQISFVTQARYNPIMKKHLFAIPNDERRSTIWGRIKVLMGMMKGVSDLFLSYPIHPHHGLYIEMKSYNGKLTQAQIEFLRDQASVGYAVYVAYSADEAWAVAMQYLDGNFEQKTRYE